MLDFKQEIAKMISKTIDMNENEIKEYIETPKNLKMGDYSFPCFRMAKELKKSPVEIANQIKDNIEIDNNIIEKLEVLNGFLNIYLNKETLVKTVLQEFDKQRENYGKSKIGEGKNIVIDYSSPNIA